MIFVHVAFTTITILLCVIITHLHLSITALITLHVARSLESISAADTTPYAVMEWEEHVHIIVEPTPPVVHCPLLPGTV